VRARIGNPYNEAHGLSCRNFDWIAPPGTSPEALSALIEAQLPGVHLQGGQGDVHGFISTSLRPDGSLYVCVTLYDFACSNPAHNHPPFLQAPAVTAPQRTALEQATGTHSINLDGTGADVARLHTLGFTDADAPLRSDAA
jgi:hypothetical protein